MSNLRFNIGNLLAITFAASLCLAAPKYGGFWLAFLIGTLSKRFELSWPRFFLAILVGGIAATVWSYYYQVYLIVSNATLGMTVKYTIQIPEYTFFGGVFMVTVGLAFGLFWNFLSGNGSPSQDCDFSESGS